MSRQSPPPGQGNTRPPPSSTASRPLKASHARPKKPPAVSGQQIAGHHSGQESKWSVDTLPSSPSQCRCHRVTMLIYRSEYRAVKDESRLALHLAVRKSWRRPLFRSTCCSVTSMEAHMHREMIDRPRIELRAKTHSQAQATCRSVPKSSN